MPDPVQTIRAATPRDARAIERLAALDSRRTLLRRLAAQPVRVR